MVALNPVRQVSAVSRGRTRRKSSLGLMPGRDLPMLGGG